MENQYKQTGERIEEIRKVLEITAAEMAEITEMSEEEYLKHESGEVDCPFSFLYTCAKRFNVDVSSLIAGDSPKLSFYTVNRAANGLPIRRREGLQYQHLAPQIKNRTTDPLRVMAQYQEEDQPIELSTHSGQEFDYVLSGQLRVQLGNKVEILNPGDSVYLDAAHPHGMVAANKEGCEFLAIVIRGESEEPLEFVTKDDAPDNGKRRLIYEDFMEEVLDENNHLKSVRFHYPDNFNFAYNVVDELARRYPEKRAICWLSREHEHRDFTFTDISRYSQQAANYLTSLGIKKGDCVMLVLRRNWQFWVVLNALHRIGAIALLASNQLLPKDFKYRYEHAKVRAIICSVDGTITDSADEAAREVPSVEFKIAVNGTYKDWLNFDEEFVKHSDVFPRPADLKATDPSIMFFSSGTTGYPKAVMHCHTYPLGHIITARWWQQVEPDGLHLTISDTGWAKALWGKVYGQWLSECAIMAYDFDRFDAADIMGLFKQFGITSFCAPPTMYRFFIREDLSKYDFSSLHHASIAGEALNPEVFNLFLKATGLKMMEGFGQTETTMVLGNIVGMTPKPGSMGRVSPLYNVELHDADGNPVKSGEVGEIVIKAEPYQVPGLFVGYGDPEATADAWHDGYYHTGDTAWCDEDGYFWYVGRIDDLIKSSGYRIGPFEIESVIMELPYVLECAVIGVPDPTRGQVVKAYIVLTKNQQPSDELVKEIQDYVKTHTAPYKYPRQVEFIPAMPKTVSGKIRRTELRNMSK